MHEARRAQAEGVTLEEADLLRERISAALKASQEACLRRRISPLDLPVPSRQALAFLSALDAEQLPIRSGPGAHGTGLRLGRLVAWRDRVQSDLTSLAQRSLKSPGQLEWLELTLSDVHASCVGLVRRVEARLAATGMQADRLPDPSRRAFRWFQWLADRSNLQSHYRAAVFCMGIDPRVVVRLYNQAALYKATLRGEHIDLTLHEAFARASEEVLLGLVKVVLPHTRKRRWRETIRLHVEGEAFRDALQMMEGSQESVSEAVQGRAYDLRDLYERVNAAYLGGKVTRPRLAWTDRPTGREFGSYQPLTDTITLSLSLDSPDVPGYVVEHVMHHELLHKLLGTPTQNGRRRVHTPAFRQLERAFPRFEEADAFLRKLSRRLLHS
jgi:predicted metal-dependent hydrolase